MSESIGVAVAEDEHGIGMAVVLGVVGGAIGIFLFVWLGYYAFTGNYGPGAVLGAFCALWGGPGFGIMAGSARHALKAERRARTASTDVAAADSVTPPPAPTAATDAGVRSGARPPSIPGSLSA